MNLLYLGTAGMLLMSLFVIFLTVWCNMKISKLLKIIHDRDVYYMKRIAELEKIMMNEFVEMTNTLKKIYDNKTMDK